MQETQKLESLGVLAGGIALDFNNLLTVILGNFGLAKQALRSESPLPPFLKSIHEGAVRAADLCTQMLNNSGRGRFVIQRLDLSQVVETTAPMLKIFISKKAELNFHLAPGLPSVAVDATQLRQVIMNLVRNASEAIGDHRGVISFTTGFIRFDRTELTGAVLASEQPEGAFVWLELTDDGSGMNKEAQEKIFDPFFTMKFTGRGLGLAAVLGIGRGHKGAFTVEFTPG
jgi:two-component system cell cycle sensor histidine kinase/response regulator CckA